MKRHMEYRGPRDTVTATQRDMQHVARFPRVAGSLLSVVACIVVLTGTAMAQDEVARGGTLVEAYPQTTESLDPHLASQRGNSWYSLAFDTLFHYRLIEGSDDQFEVVPALATSYELIDDTTIELQLREGVEFHDGTPWNASAAKWNIERARDHETSSVSETVANVTNVEVVDEHTIRVLLEEPQPTFFLQMTPANPVTVHMVSPTAVEEMGEDEFARNPVGTGPMQFVEWEPDERLVLERFPDHWEQGRDGQPLPYIDRYEQRIITDQSVGRLELQAGTIDVMFDPLAQDFQLIEQDGNLTLQRVPLTYRGFPSFYFNPRPEVDSAFTEDVRLRQAVQHAVDREAMASALGFGYAEPHYYWGWYPGVPGYDPDLPRYEYDPERSRELLEEAGASEGIELEVKAINRPSDIQPLEVLQAMLAEVGIDLTINAMDRLEWIDDGRSGNFEALSHGNTAQPSPMLRQETRTGSTYNWAGYSSDAVDALWDEVESVYDEQRRVEIYQEIQRELYNDAYHLVGYRIPQMVALRSSVEGMTTLYNFRYVSLNE